MFVLEPSDHANASAPGIRPLPTITPAFVLTDGQPWLSFGLLGGAMRAQGRPHSHTNPRGLHLNPQGAGRPPLSRPGRLNITRRPRCRPSP